MYLFLIEWVMAKGRFCDWLWQSLNSLVIWHAASVFYLAHTMKGNEDCCNALLVITDTQLMLLLDYGI